ncbi:MAG TPA: WD40 repeat domain-containing protein [Ktedonobacteraceae bacterium]
MAEIDRDEGTLEQRLREHYQQHYEPSPPPEVVWERLQPVLDSQEKRAPRLAQRPRRLAALAPFLAARRRDAFAPGQREAYLMENPPEAEPVQTRRWRLKHTLEAAMATLLVTSLLLGWFVVSRWRSVQGNGSTPFTYISQPGEVAYDIHWTPDGKHLAFVIYTIATNQYSYRVWDVATGKARQTFALKLPAAIIGRAMLDAQNGSYALIRTNGATSREWVLKLANVLTGQIQQIYQGRYQGQGAEDLPAAAFSADSQYLAFVGANQRVYIWDIAAGKVLRITDPLTLPGNAAVRQLAWSMDNKRVMANSAPAGLVRPALLQIWSAQTGHTLLNFVETPAISLAYPIFGANSFAGLSPDATRILTYNQQKQIFTERASDTLQILQTFPVKMGSPNSGGYGVFWEANGTRLLWQNYQMVSIWNASTGKPVLNLSLENISSTLLMASGGEYGGEYITRRQSGNLLEIWDMVTGMKMRTLVPAINALFVGWSPDARYLDLNDGKQNGQIFAALTGKLLTDYQGDGALLSTDSQFVAVKTNLSADQTSSNLRQVMLQILPVH